MIDKSPRTILMEWMREPDYADFVDTKWLMDWANRRPAAALLALSPPQPTEGKIEVLFAGLDDRLDRLCVNDTDGSRFILSGVSAHNITEIAKEWVRSSLRAMPLQDHATKWRHKKRGSIVTEIARGFAQVAHHPIEEMAAVVIYRHDEDGCFWVRNAVEFDDGRFEPFPAMVAEEETKS